MRGEPIAKERRSTSACLVLLRIGRRIERLNNPIVIEGRTFINQNNLCIFIGFDLVLVLSTTWALWDRPELGHQSFASSHPTAAAISELHLAGRRGVRPQGR